jgi:cytochrome o ubiquinol oxidase subunit II
MSKKQKLGLMGIVIVILLSLLGWYLHNSTVAVLETRGTVGNQEKHLIVIALLLSLVVVIPVYAMLIGFSLRYREGNSKARYQPDFDHSRLIETVWWGVPIALITILGVITWHSSNQLDPFKPINSRISPLTVQVVALQWKWLFIYPDQNVASVNFAQIPVGRPVKFEITSDAPMNSFWVPQLGGQIYAMSGMATELNLEADQPGTYRGLSANISGDGFADMNFSVRAGDQSGFDNWVKSAKQDGKSLTNSIYNRLAAPSNDNKVAYYAAAQPGLFQAVINKYEAPLLFKPAEQP